MCAYVAGLLEPCFDANIFVCVCVGHRLHRMTSLEREEKEKVRKREKKQEEEETMLQATWVKYTFRVKHQVKISKSLCAVTRA